MDALAVNHVPIPLEGVTVTVEVKTQHGDPDNGGSPVDRITVWRETRFISNTWGFTLTTYVMFSREFMTNTNLSATKPISTPTDYFLYNIYINDPHVPAIGPVEHAFLMENQYEADLGTDDATGIDHSVRVHHCDMFPFGQGNTIASWLPRAQAHTHVNSSLIPMMQEIFDTEVNNWGFESLHPGWDEDRVVEVYVSEGDTYFHLGGGVYHYGHYDGVKWTPEQRIALDSNFVTYQLASSLDEGERSAFSHEFFHSMQHSIGLHENYTPASAAWSYVIEGQAILAQSVASLSSPNDAHYVLDANQYLRDLLNTSFEVMNLYPRDGGHCYEAALYWRFLFEQSGGVGNPAQGMEIIRSILREMATRTSTEDFLTNFGPAMNNAFAANENAPHENYEESLLAFARANYSLRLDDSEYYEQPGNPVYTEPPTDSWPPYRLGDSGPVYHTGEITSSFGMDFAEVKMIGLVSGTVLSSPLVIRFEQSNPAEEFHVQFLHLAPGNSPRRSGSGNRLKISQVHTATEVIPIQGGTGERTII